MKKKLIQALLNLILAKDELEYISNKYHYPAQIKEQIDEKIGLLYERIWWIEDVLEAGLV